jgi:hypothetical protein
MVHLLLVAITTALITQQRHRIPNSRHPQLLLSSTARRTVHHLPSPSPTSVTATTTAAAT